MGGGRGDYWGPVILWDGENRGAARSQSRMEVQVRLRRPSEISLTLVGGPV